MDLKECLQQAINAHASDVFIIAGLPVSLRKNNIISQFTEERLLPADTENILADIYQYAGNRDMKRLHETGDDDFCYQRHLQVPCQRLQAARLSVCGYPYHHL